jgi:hypothetical protein
MLMFATSTSLAQTKEETIKWLTEKFSKSLTVCTDRHELLNFSIDECEIIISFRYTKEWSSYDDRRIIYVPLKDLTITPLHFRFGLNYEGVRVVNSYKAKWDGASVDSLRADYYSSDSYPIAINETEPNLHERIIKAITHLNTFCVEEEEPF